MISNFEHLDKLFKELNDVLKEKVHFYIIGGAVMLFHGLKIGTKDVDIIVDSLLEFKIIERTLKEIGFDTKIPNLEYKNVDISQIFVREDYRINLFQKTVCKGFSLSEKMKKRAQTIRKSNNLSVSLCSTTDIFMFKTFTERDGDIDDCISLAEKGIDWGAMLQEINEQIKNSGQSVWITYIGERIEILGDRGLAIPIMNEINKLIDKFFNELEKKQNN